MSELLLFLLTAPPDAASFDSFAAWWGAHRELGARWRSPIDRAIAGGFAADRLGFAFAAGYHAALSALIPSLGPGAFAALCATEDGGAHPRAIRTSLVRGEDGRLVLRGKKRWATLASRADQLFIVASTGADQDGKNRLRVVRVGVDRPGLRIDVMPETPFAPEIPHAEVTLEGVPVEEADVLEGDGYDVYLKPFRTVEDVHVHGALLGYLVGVGRRYRWPAQVLERLSAALVCARSLAGELPSAPEVHIAVAGMLDETRRIVEETAGLWELVSEGERARWARDRGLLEVAGKARAARRERAWETLTGRAR
jgi:acyl-CoA dehydrogenase